MIKIEGPLTYKHAGIIIIIGIAIAIAILMFVIPSLSFLSTGSTNESTNLSISDQLFIPIFIIVSVLLILGMFSMSSRKFIIPILMMVGLITYLYYSPLVIIIINIFIMYFIVKTIFSSNVEEE